MMKIYLLEVYELGSRQNLFDNQLLVEQESPGERNFFLDLVSSFDSLRYLLSMPYRAIITEQSVQSERS